MEAIMPLSFPSSFGVRTCPRPALISTLPGSEEGLKARYPASQETTFTPSLKAIVGWRALAPLFKLSSFFYSPFIGSERGRMGLAPAHYPEELGSRLSLDKLSTILIPRGPWFKFQLLNRYRRDFNGDPCVYRCPAET